MRLNLFVLTLLIHINLGELKFCPSQNGSRLCPYQKGNCCKNLNYCCPQGFLCLSHPPSCAAFIPSFTKQVFKPIETIDLVSSTNQILKLNEKSSLGNLSIIICPDRKTACQYKQTCCKNEESYSCCPHENGVCCSDGKHCCAFGETCDVKSGECIGPSIDWASGMNFLIKKKNEIHPFLRLTAKKECPGGSGLCEDSETCCLSLSGTYGCCPYPQATCCSDKIHCCPHATTCDEVAKRCISQNSNLSKLIDFNSESLIENFIEAYANSSLTKYCPGKKQACQDDQTCCKLKSGNYGCCPFEKGVCCQDLEHCCPEGTTCDMSTGSCRTSFEEDTKIETKPFGEILLSNYSTNSFCPDGRHRCTGEETCCKLKSGEYGCCPYERGICCSDGEHCCPEGTICDSGICRPPDLNDEFASPEKMLKLTKIKPEYFNSSINSDCPDRRHSCSGEKTCCKLKSGDYGCCPYDRGVCCSDGEHCCPENTVCDSSGICRDRLETSPKKIDTISQKCPDNSTCCETPSGAYGSCPFENGICCQDKANCCPSGHVCTITKTGTICEKSTSDLTVPSKIVQNCADGSQCGTNETCCIMKTGNFGCCIFPEAVCCRDKLHCCPKGFTCHTKKAECTNSFGISIPWQEKVATYFEIKALDILVECPKNVSCPYGSTCCAKKNGAHGCCMLGTNVSLDYLVVCPDHQVSCDEKHQTCCPDQLGHFRCCVFPNAVCCSDGTCCPSGSSCGGFGCKKLQNPVSEANIVKLEDPPVVCPNGRHKCPPRSICCPDDRGSYGCCKPHGPQAVCCRDGRHCCWNGYQCDEVHHRCVKPRHQFYRRIRIFEEHEDVTMATTTATVMDNQTTVVCPDSNYQCPKNSVCCPRSGGGYSCCLKEQGVCCKDQKHCCAKGTVCDEENMRCVIAKEEMAKPDNYSTPWCSGHKVRCPPHYTCCTSDSQITVCCPLQNAVCCKAFGSCCPHGQECSPDGMSCLSKRIPKFPENILNQLNRRTSSLLSSQPDIKNTRLLCKGGNSFCPLSSSCCHSPNTISGSSCCPYKNAVCCGDGFSCCPENSQCDLESGVCKSGNAVRALMLLTRVSYTDELTSQSEKLCEVCHRHGARCCSNEQGDYECFKENFPTKCCADGAGACPERFECLADRCLNAFGISVPRLNKILRYEDLLERSWTINLQKRGFEFPVRPNLQAFRDQRLSNGLYRLIKSLHWNICERSNFFCAKDRDCCANGVTFTCMPKGSVCCINDGNRSNCPVDYKCGYNTRSDPVCIAKYV